MLDGLNRLTESVHYVKKAIEINPNEAEYWYVFAEVQQKLGFIEESALAYERVIELEYNEVDVWIDFSTMLHQAGYLKEANEALMQGIKRFPDSAELIYRIGVVLLDLANTKAAMEYFSIALDMDFQKHEIIFEYAPNLINNTELNHLISIYKK